MKITHENYYDIIKDVDFAELPEALRKSSELVDKLTKNNTSWAQYENNPTYKRIVDLYFEELSHALKKEPKPEIIQEPKKEEKIAPEKTENKTENEKPKKVKRQSTKLLKVPTKPLNPSTELLKESTKPLKKSTKSLKKHKTKKHTHHAKQVEKRHVSVDFIKRYANLHGKEVGEKRIDSLLSSLQKAILEKRIRKTDPHADLIHHIQGQLIKLYKEMGASVTVNIADIEKYKNIGISEAQLPSIKLLKRYAGLLANYHKEKAEKLHTDIKKSIETGKVKGSDSYFNHLSLAETNLHESITKSGKLEPTEAELNGLRGINLWPIVVGYIAGRAVDKVFDTAIHHTVKTVTKHAGTLKKKSKKFHVLGCADKVCTCNQHVSAYSGLGNAPVQYIQPPVQPVPHYPQPISYLPMKPAGRMSVTEAISARYEVLGLEREWLNLIGEACKPTSFFIYGAGGSGKSTLSLMFANYMAQKGHKVLYVAREQFGTPVFAKMLQRLNIADTPYFVIAKDLVAESPANFDIVVLDSKDSLSIELPQFIELRKRYPNQSFVVLSQATKDGNFTGSEKWRNEVDTMIICEKGVAYTSRDKNRWGGSGEVRIF